MIPATSHSLERKVAGTVPDSVSDGLDDALGPKFVNVVCREKLESNRLVIMEILLIG